MGGGETSKIKLKDTSFIFPMTNVTILGVFHTHAQKKYGKVFSTFIFLKLAKPLLKVWSKQHSV